MASNRLFIIFIFASMVIGSWSYVMIVTGDVGKSADHEGYCYYEPGDVLIKKGETKILRGCEEASCDNDYGIHIRGCPSFTLHDPNCNKFIRDYTKLYPKCCSEFICVEMKTDDSDVNSNKI